MAYWKGSASSSAVTHTAWTTWEIEGIPENCMLAELVLVLTDITEPNAKVTVFVSHDDDGLIGVVPFVTSSATQRVNVRDPEEEEDGAGFVAFSLGGVWVSDKGENPRVHCKLDSGSATATPRLYAHREGQR